MRTGTSKRGRPRTEDARQTKDINISNIPLEEWERIHENASQLKKTLRDFCRGRLIPRPSAREESQANLLR